MGDTIRRVAVLGAGTMGAQIAAHLANAGLPVLLLDVTLDAAKAGVERAKRTKPDPAFTADSWSLISIGAFDTDFPRIADVDWIIEAIVEQIDVKRPLLERVDQHRTPGSVVSSNTSALSIGELAEGRSDDFRRHWLGTHFFNPPRYLHLLEVIPGPETSRAVVDRVTRTADRQLGKGVVLAKDAPGFIGNHIALYAITGLMAAVAEGGYTLEEVDAITGPAIGRPKSATFRTMDLAGLDIVAHVVRDLNRRLRFGPAQGAFALPAFVEAMVARGAIGEKAGRGFYQRVKRPDGASEILAIDPNTLEYRPSQRARLASLEATQSIEDVRERVRALFRAQDRVGAFLRSTLAPSLVYAAHVAPHVAASIDDVDRVMRWGFGWDLGPFELMDAIGVREVLDAARTAGAQVGDTTPPLIQELLDRGRTTFRDGPLPPAAPDLEILRTAREQTRIVKSNAGASLVDLGDGVLCVEFHSKMNTVGVDTMQMLQAGVREAARNHLALVVGNDAPAFCAGANLMLLLLEAQEENWDEIDAMVRMFQQTTMGLRYADVPVVVAPAGLSLGAGPEMALHADRVQAAAETYTGLVEVGVGLIPAGGGTKEMVARAAESVPAGTRDLLPAVQVAFETIAFAKVSTSATDARRLGYVRPVDGITMNRDRLLSDAKARALARVREGYQPPPRRTAIPVGGDTVLAPLKLGIHLAWRAGRISEYDVAIGQRLATIMAGGRLPNATTVTEQHLLDLEREAFMSLIAERRTQERIQHMLKTGKPLRN